MNQCPACGESVSGTARFCFGCGAKLAGRASSVPSRQARTVELSQELERLGSWGGNNALADFFDSLFPFAGLLVRVLLFLLNPFWIVTSAIFGAQGTERLKKGEVYKFTP